MTTYYKYVETPLGNLLLTHDGEALTGLYFADQKHAPVPEADWIEDKGGFSETLRQLDEYFAKERTSFDLKLHLRGTDFQKKIWQYLFKIPYGQHTTYKAVAQAIGRPKAVRAVGTAIGQNPICVIGPCHRVLTTSGELGGYAGGTPNKQFLLDLED